MYAATFIERSRASLEYARQTVGTVRTAVRNRAGSLNIRSFHCGGHEDSRGLSRSFTASAQSLSARRVDIDRSPPSPTDVQQSRYSAFGQGWAAVQERFVVENTDPSRDDEYPSISSKSTSAGYDEIDDNRAYTTEPICIKEEECPNKHRTLNTPAYTIDSPQIQGYRTPPASLEASIPDWQFDAELHLAKLIQRCIEARKFSLNSLQARTQKRSHKSISRQRQRRNIPGEAERRKGRVFDSVTDHTQPELELHEGINPRLTGHQLEPRTILGLVPTRRALPRSPPVVTAECIPVRIVSPASRRRGRRRKNYKPQPDILMSKFKPIIGEDRPFPLNNLPRDIISTTTTIVSTSSSSFPYPRASPLPTPPTRPAPPPPSTSHITNRHRLQKLAASFILTDAEFPRELSRNGPGSRFPSHVVDFPNQPAHEENMQARGRLPDVVLISPTDTSRSHSPTAHATHSPPAQRMESYPYQAREHIHYSPPSTVSASEPSNHGSSPPSSAIGTDITVQSSTHTPRVYLPYRPPPTHPASTAVAAPDPNVDNDVIRQAVAMNLIHYPSPSSSPSPPPTSSSPTTAAGSTMRTLSPATSLMSNASFIRRVVDAGIINFDPPVNSDGAGAGARGQVKGERNGGGKDNGKWKRLTVGTAGWEGFGGSWTKF
ncbi:MAG: hypothetical protein Q9209_003880 [Squamulea sp. 1 TL-2023]